MKKMKSICQSCRKEITDSIIFNKYECVDCRTLRRYLEERTKKIKPIFKKNIECLSCKKLKPKSSFSINKFICDFCLKYEKMCTENTKDYKRNYNRKRRGIIKNIKENFTIKELKKKLKHTNGICNYCKNFIGINDLTVDHIYPISLANEDYIKTGIKKEYYLKDIQFLCKSCNSRKGNKLTFLNTNTHQ